jgi:hypothetical protein
VDLDPGGRFSAEVTLPTGDCALLLLGSCDPAGDCLVYADENQTGEPETIAWTNHHDMPITIYLVVDAWAPAQPCGTYTGSYTCSPAGQPLSAASWGQLKATYH